MYLILRHELDPHTPTGIGQQHPAKLLEVEFLLIDPDRYALLACFMNFDADITWTLNYTVKHMTDGPVQMRNGDSNNAGSFSSNNVNGSNFWPDGTFEPVNFSELPAPRRGLPVPLKDLYQLREKIFQDHVNYQQGYMYFMANDPQVPKDLQERVNKFGLDPNEFPNTGHWPHSIYVREGRRMLSDYVMNQSNCNLWLENRTHLKAHPTMKHLLVLITLHPTLT